MTIFALDSAGKTAGVALWQNGALLYESYLACTGTHSETLLPLCDAAFRTCRLSPSDMDAFALNAGPGSFTGLRIGMGIVKGFAFTSNVPCAPVSTLDALAHTYPADGLIATALDARRGEVYCALFRRKNGAVHRLTPDNAMSAVDFSALASAQLESELAANGLDGTIAASASNLQTVTCMGDGAHLLAGDGLVPCPAPYRFGRANGICLAAEAMLARGEGVSAVALSPDYLRLSQAERERAARLASHANATCAADSPRTENSACNAAPTQGA